MALASLNEATMPVAFISHAASLASFPCASNVPRDERALDCPLPMPRKRRRGLWASSGAPVSRAQMRASTFAFSRASEREPRGTGGQNEE